MKRKLTALVLALALVCALGSIGAQAATPAEERAAESLCGMGLFRGVGTLPDGSYDFALDRAPTRGEAVTMLVRLLGAEQTALAEHGSHPFRDAGWASDYVGYAYGRGITNGVSETMFGTGDPVTQAQYLTLTLRALGYTDTDWRDPWPRADAVGLQYGDGDAFTRGEAAVISRSALDCTICGTEETLGQRLAAAGALAVTPGPMVETVYEANAATTDQVVDQLQQAVFGHGARLQLTVPRGQERAFCDAVGECLDDIGELEGVKVSFRKDSGILLLDFEYTDAARIMAYLEGKRSSLSEKDQQTLSAARQVVDSLADVSMSNAERARAFHDYLCRNVIYDLAGDESYDAYGALVRGVAVCDGYSKAYDLLCYLAGVPCIRVGGTSENGLHSWNMVKADGAWYHVDVTWDDSVMANGPGQWRPRWDYFLVSDSTIGRDHQWGANVPWPAAPANYPRSWE